LESSLDFAALRAFIASHIENYEQLETLLLLRRRGQSVSAAIVASELKLEAHEVNQALRALASCNLVTVDDSSGSSTFRYSPLNDDLSLGVELLALAYEEHRIKLIQLMNANALDRARMIALRKFAEGFRLGGPKKNG
jgi:DNA-directed RNA polymerase specialized sigma subunit